PASHCPVRPGCTSSLLCRDISGSGRFPAQAPASSLLLQNALRRSGTHSSLPVQSLATSQLSFSQRPRKRSLRSKGFSRNFPKSAACEGSTLRPALLLASKGLKPVESPCKIPVAQVSQRTPARNDGCNVFFDWPVTSRNQRATRPPNRHKSGPPVYESSAPPRNQNPPIRVRKALSAHVCRGGLERMAQNRHPSAGSKVSWLELRSPGLFAGSSPLESVPHPTFRSTNITTRMARDAEYANDESGRSPQSRRRFSNRRARDGCARSRSRPYQGPGVRTRLERSFREGRSKKIFDFGYCSLN